MKRYTPKKERSTTPHNLSLSSGFTIIELPIVIIVIAILAGLVISAYSGIQGIANDAAVKSDLDTLNKKLRIQYSTSNTYHASVLWGLDFKAAKSSYAISPTAAHNLTYCYNDSDPSIYAVIALSKSGKKYTVSNTGGVTEFTGSYACSTVAGSTMPNSNNGYAASDTTTGPWRAWAGGN